MNHVDAHPDPGPEPPRTSLELQFEHIQWIRKVRKHNVAKAVDHLLTLPTHTSEQTIAIVLGVSFLDDTLSSHSPLAGLF